MIAAGAGLAADHGFSGDLAAAGEGGGAADTTEIGPKPWPFFTLGAVLLILS